MKLPNIKHKKLILGTAILGVTLLGGVALAQEVQRTVTLTYPVVEASLNPGEKSEGVTRITNDTDAPLTFKAAVEDFIVTDSLGTPQLLPLGTIESKYSGASWIAVYPSEFTVQPHQRQDLNYYIQVPANARPGGHYAAVVYTPEVKTADKGTGSTVNSQLGTIFKLIVKGPVLEKASITNFLAKSFQEYGPVKIMTQIRNYGDIHTRPNAKITVTGPFFNQTYTLPQHDVFPGAARDYENFVGQQFMFGKYTAVLSGTYGFNSVQPLSATVSFWVFPWKLTTLAVLIVIAVILLILYLRKRSRRGGKKEEGPKVQNPGVLHQYHTPAE